VVLITQTMEEAALARRVVALHGGRIVMDGPSSQVLAHQEPLRELGLDLPLAARIAHLLRQQGMPLETGLTTTQHLAAALGALGLSEGAPC
jgi:energy-coupling factor transport system ATP-binding protein